MTQPSCSAYPPEEDAAEARYLIGDLCRELEAYLPPEQIREVYGAYLYGAEAHLGQRRLSGEPYIYHPIAVARILAGMRMDYRCLMAAILHDVIEDTAIGKEQLAALFGDEVALLVDGVSKLDKVNFESRAEAQAANFRKMFFAMAQDLRVILIKLADRLHNMRTLGAMRQDKQRRIAAETLGIYAPIANRLGINHLRIELEQLGFESYWPMRSRILCAAAGNAVVNRRDLFDKVENALRNRLAQEGIPADVSGREKHLYSIYQKMKEKHLHFSEVYDVFGFRLVVDNLDACYRVLGVVHNLYSPMPGKFKDYIALQKPNGYQSLHTILKGPGGVPIEIQIRTREMHQVAECGVAAHWMYKAGETGSGSLYNRASDWLRNLLELQQGAGNPMEFLEGVKTDLFPDEVYVFTPTGDIKVLPRGSTVIDFAYAVHSDLGDRCVGAFIDRRPMPLRTRLANGQTVKVTTRPDSRPKAAWLQFVATAKARARIRQFLKNLEEQEAVTLGRRLLEAELKIQGLTLDGVGPERIRRVLDQFKLPGLSDLLREIGLGNRMVRLVARLLQQEPDTPAEAPAPPPPAGALAIKGTEGMVVNYARCCRPIPGDEIIAMFNPGKGIVVHRQGCPNLGDYRRQGNNWLDVGWEQEPQGEFLCEICVEVGNNRGVLATVAREIAGMESNIENVKLDERDGFTSVLQFAIAVHGRRHLAAIIRRLRRLPEVMKVARTGSNQPQKRDSN